MNQPKRILYNYLHDFHRGMEWGHPMTLNHKEEKSLKETLKLFYDDLKLEQFASTPIILDFEEVRVSLPNLSRRQQGLFVSSISISRNNEIGGAFHQIADFIENYNEGFDNYLSCEEKKALKTMINEALKVRLFNDDLEQVKNAYDEKTYNVLSLTHYCRQTKLDYLTISEASLEKFKIKNG